MAETKAGGEGRGKVFLKLFCLAVVLRRDGQYKKKYLAEKENSHPNTGH